MKKSTQNQSSSLNDSEHNCFKIAGVSLGTHRDDVVQILGKTPLENQSQDTLHFAIFGETTLDQSVVVSYLQERVAMISGPSLDCGTTTLESNWGRLELLRVLGRPSRVSENGSNAQLEFHFPGKTLRIRMRDERVTTYALQIESPH